MAAAQAARKLEYAQQQQQQQQQPQQQQPPQPPQQQQQHPRVLYRRPTSVGVPKAPDDWLAEEGSSVAPLAPTPSVRGNSAPSPSTRRAASQHVVWAKDAHSPPARPPRPASAGSPGPAAAAAAAAAAAPGGSGGGDGNSAWASSGASSPAGGGGGGGGARVFGGSPSLNAAAAVLAERQAMAEALATLRPQCRCCRDGGCNPPSSIGGCRKDVEGLSEELRRLRGELAACQEQNRLIRTERQRMEEELNRCRTSLIKAEEVLNARERSLSPNAGMSRLFRSPSTTSLVAKLKEQLAAQTAQSESLRAQLDEVMRGTRATRVSELQAEVKAQERELCRQAEMVRVMRRRMEEAEARAAEAIDRRNDAERLARLQAPLAALQQAITVSEAKFGSRPPTAAPATAAGGGTVPGPASGTASGIGAAMPGEDGPASPKAGEASGQQQLQPGAVGPQEHGGACGAAAVLEGAPPPSSPAQKAAAAAASAPSSSSLAQPSSSSSPPSSSPLSGRQTLTSGRIKKTMAALGDAHRALLSQATLLSELFPPGLSTEQLCVRAALRPATSGAPEVLRYLRHHVHKMVDVLSVLPGNRLEMMPEEEPSGGHGTNNRNRSGGGNRQRGGGGGGTPRTSMTGQVLRASGGGVGGKGGGGRSGGGGVTVVAQGEFDPWSLLSELLDFVRWLRGLDESSLATRPDLEGGLEQLSSVVGICDQETRRLLGRLGGAVAGNGA